MHLQPNLRFGEWEKVEGEMEMKTIRKGIEIQKLVSQENDSREEESDTEDSYEFEITSQQLSQITPGGGALKIKLSKKRPLKITAGAPGGSQTIPMELEHIPSPKRLDPRSQVDTTSESTLPTRGTGAPLFISPILPESDLEPLEETSPK